MVRTHFCHIFAHCLIKFLIVAIPLSHGLMALFIPLHKKGSVNDENNYSDITLLITLGKLFTRILNLRLSYWSEKYSV